MNENKNLENKNTTLKENTQKKENLSEKFEDRIDDFFGGIQDSLYGENPDYTKDIPATYETPSGIRKVNKVQTRRNLNKRIFKKPVIKGLIIGISIGICILLVYKLIEIILMA